MALKNTSDRYNYIYGNAVRKTDIPGDGQSGRRYKKGKATSYSTTSTQIRTSYQDDDNTSGTRRRRRRRAASDFDWKYTLIVCLAFSLIIACSIFYVKGTIVIHNLYNEVTELKKQKSDLLDKQNALKSDIDSATNLDEIRNYALKKLKMVYPGKDQIIYYTDDNRDYIRQYESVDAGN